MVTSESLITSISTEAANATNFIKQNLGIIGGAVGGAALGTVVGVTAANLVSAKKTKKKRKAKSKNKRKKRYRTHKHRKRKNHYARTTGKRKDTSHKRIRMTKNGQPYIILASGKARFIKKSSARHSRRRKGGRY